MLLALGASHLFAQKKALSPEERAEKAKQKLSKELSLSSEQAEKVKSIILARNTEIQNLRAQNITDKKAFHSQAKTIREKARAELKATLTEEQYKKFEAKKAEMKKKRMSQKGKKKPVTEDTSEEDDLE